MSFKRNFWIIKSYRPKMKLVDVFRNPVVKALYDIRTSDDILVHPRARGMKAYLNIHASLDHTPEELKDMVWAEADEDGDFITEDPVLAFAITQELDKCGTLNNPNHPLKPPVKWELEKMSASIPTKEEVDKILKERKEKEELEASKAKK